MRAGSYESFEGGCCFSRSRKLARNTTWKVRNEKERFCMHYEETDVVKRLHGLAHRMTSDPVLHEEYFAVVWENLWLVEAEHPNESLSWYLENCRNALS